MLILRRKKNESLLIGDNIRITIVDCAGDGVRLAIDAPNRSPFYGKNYHRPSKAIRRLWLPALIPYSCFNLF